jgi:hypothetical protein
MTILVDKWSVKTWKLGVPTESSETAWIPVSRLETPQTTARLGRLSRIKMAIYAGTDKSAQVVFSFGERVKAALAGELKILSVGEVDLTLPSP